MLKKLRLPANVSQTKNRVIFVPKFRFRETLNHNEAFVPPSKGGCFSQLKKKSKSQAEVFPSPSIPPPYVLCEPVIRLIYI
jgi:hypothetical protein